MYPKTELTDSETEHCSVRRKHPVVDAERRRDGCSAPYHQRYVINQQRVRPWAITHPPTHHTPNRVSYTCTKMTIKT